MAEQPCNRARTALAPDWLDALACCFALGAPAPLAFTASGGPTRIGPGRPLKGFRCRDPQRRLHIHHRYFHCFVRHGLNVGTVEIAGDAACAVWLPSDAPDPDHELAAIAERPGDAVLRDGRPRITGHGIRLRPLGPAARLSDRQRDGRRVGLARDTNVGQTQSARRDQPGPTRRPR
jgi:hypothetical protein